MSLSALYLIALVAQSDQVVPDPDTQDVCIGIWSNLCTLPILKLDIDKKEPEIEYVKT